MKKLILTALFAISAIAGVYAQASTKAIGVAASYGTEISSLGVGGRIQYNYTDPVRFELGADYFFKADYTTMWDVNLNVNYIFNMSPKVNIYPLAGVFYSNWKFDYDQLNGDLGQWFDNFDLGEYNTAGQVKHVSRVGANIGVGGEYMLMPNVAANFELKYQFMKDFNQVVFGVGIAYRFK